MASEFSGPIQPGPDGPYENAALVTPHDSNDLPFISKALWIGGAGNVRVLTKGGQDVILTGVPVGLLRLRVHRVFSTSTTATNIAFFY